MATIKDVAQKAGLSVSTVSRFLNNHPYISDVKKKKIQEAMIDLDYVPNSAATQLRSNKSFALGVIVSRITNPYFAYLIDAIENTIRTTPYHTLIMQTYDDKDEELRLLNMLKQKHIDGVIMGSLENDISVVEKYTKYGPIVLSADKTVQSNKVMVVHTDQRQATYEAIQYLINKGHSTIAYCTGGNYFASRHGRSRNLGFRDAMNDNGLEIKREWIFNNAHTLEDGEKIGKILWQSKRLPDAIFAGSDEVASGIIQVMTNYNINIPDDIAIMGYDNQPFSKLLKIPLTTVNQPVNEIGRQLTEFLLSVLEDVEFNADDNLLKLEIIERKST
ncbi:LacI family DNA-binding transcriptional regulator [Staphylococcus caledonicus]|uniref:LacI family DNA-binding transcriptional regulator n=1 Tax=Staphylococcus caledonicus TaxID=2741333 RepID=UPI0018E4CBB1|nr:LacI family DNA-binding transcriptional regulator [Staphylococcus caledonicus]MBI5972980.1 LacI family DNA-binding transcriptional regulator [Staphylococcus caledonicus]